METNIPKKAKNRFERQESYMHLHAKLVLYGALVAEEKKPDDYSVFGQMKWRSNYGVFCELPFHEKDNPYYFEMSAGIENYDDNPMQRFNPKIDRGKILFVPDICIFHKGTPIYFVEIVHTNSVSEQKKEAISLFFNGYTLMVYEVRATDIMKCTSVEQLKKLVFNCILNTY